MTFVIVTGGIDLSVGSILGLCAILIGVFWKTLGLPLPVAVGLSMVVERWPASSTGSSSPASACRR